MQIQDIVCVTRGVDVISVYFSREICRSQLEQTAKMKVWMFLSNFL